MSKEDSKHTTAEKVTIGISIAILTCIIGLASWASFATGSAPATIEVEVQMGEIRETESGFYVPVIITNTGGLTAQNATVTGELVIEGEEPETAEVTIDFLSGGESERAELVFSAHPDEGEFSVAATSYLHP